MRKDHGYELLHITTISQQTPIHLSAYLQGRSGVYPWKFMSDATEARN